VAAQAYLYTIRPNPGGHVPIITEKVIIIMGEHASDIIYIGSLPTTPDYTLQHTGQRYGHSRHVQVWPVPSSTILS
jgi:hypothetical protein